MSQPSWQPFAIQSISILSLVSVKESDFGRSASQISSMTKSGQRGGDFTCCSSISAFIGHDDDGAVGVAFEGAVLPAEFVEFIVIKSKAGVV